ncbi:hypothetical protein [Lederbergia lenta]|uniref:Uncharacterized protein n=1 Tax=Lederbergia lenta TaxID=1467 RepID=A0A2X4VLD6_LEDLE|nr:hypothetical protein [Lederbergia lenta]MEC2323680.1 hypothetical protein [Lederbergia lenta]SQI51641.1 Uncharacterised protein [Lederbergia lenta]
MIGGVLYVAGSWVYNAVKSFLKAETADQIISKKKKASIRKEFPSEYLNKTLNEIEKDAKAGKARAKKAKKLLTDKRFNK